MTQIISQSTTWSGTVTLTGEIQIAAGATLTISPGAVIIGNNNTIQTFGTLAASGTLGSPTTFDTVQFAESNNISEPATIQLNYAVINGGRFLPPSGAGYGKWSITNTTLDNVGPIYDWYPTGSVLLQNDIFDATELSVGSSGATITVDHDTFKNWGNNILSSSAIEDWANYSNSALNVTNSNFLDSGKIALELPPGYNSSGMTSAGNYFGTSDPTIIARMIYDKTVDLTSSGPISNTNIQTSPVPALFGVGGATPTVVIDTAADISTRLDSLEVLAGSGQLTSVQLTNTGIPALTLSLGQLLGDADALHFIVAPFNVAIPDVGIRDSFPSIETHDLGASSAVRDVRLADGTLVFDPNAAAAQISRLYQAALGRGPDQGGLHSWIGQLDAGTPLTAIAADFIASPEFAARYGAGLSDGGFVTQLYSNVLQRAPDPGGYSAWTATLAAGTSREAVLVGFSESPENRANTAGTVNAGIWDLDQAAPSVARLYDTVLGRLPDAPGLQFWDNQIDSGAMSLATVANLFVGSAEFQAAYGALSNQDFVTTLYANALHRAPDPGGLAAWVGTLNGGALTRSAVVLGFSESLEHQADTAGNIISDAPASFGIKFA